MAKRLGTGARTNGSTKALLESVLRALKRGDAPDNKYPDRRGEYWPLCEFHHDRHHGSFCVGERGYKCFSCGAGGSLHQLARHLGVTVAGLHGNSGRTSSPPSPTLTLEQYADCKQLPVSFLDELGLRTIHLVGKPALKMPYYDANGNETSARFRLTLDGKQDRFRWRKGSKVLPYGLWKLDEAIDAGYIILVEGESDAQTLWLYNLPAFGIPGASVWKPEWAEYFADLTVYVWQEPDAGGTEFVDRLGDTLPEAMILTPPKGRKDISECHILGDDVLSLVEEIRERAEPYQKRQTEALSKAAAEAKGRARSLISHPDILTAFAAVCKQLGLVGEERTAKVLYLAVTSRFLERPVNVVVKGPSSGGKSFTAEQVLRTFPEGAFYALSGMSERALAYSEEPLSHRMLVIYEAAGMSGEYQKYLIRSLLSEGRIRYETVEKTVDGLASRLIEREGPTGLIVTTTSISLHPENETRMLSLTVRDDPNQTKKILHALARKAKGETPPEVDLSAWHGLQEWLELAGLREVIIPYADRLAELATPSSVRLRRDFGTILKLVQAHAILHQETRAQVDGRIIASLDDYRVVYSLVADVVDEGARAAVNNTVREAVEAVIELRRIDHNRPIRVSQVAEHLEIDDSAALRRVQRAIREGYLVNLEDRKGRPARLVLGESLPEEHPVLPHPDMLIGGQGGDVYPSVSPATMQPINVKAPDELWEGVL